MLFEERKKEMQMVKYILPIACSITIVGCAAQNNTTHFRYQPPAQEIIAVPNSVNQSFNNDRKIAVLIRRTSFGIVPGDIKYVAEEGTANYLGQQLNPEFINDSLCDTMIAELPVMTMTPRQLYENYPPPFLIKNKFGKDAKIDPRRSTREIIRELEIANLIRDVYSERQLQAIMTEFWLNHFNIYAIKGLVPYYLVDFVNTVRANALGTFPQLLKAVAMSPAMLIYLDNWESASPNFKSRKRFVVMRLRQEWGPFTNRQELLDRLGAAFFMSQGLNENYGRELMELHTIGLHYTQRDVIAAARCLTGWTVAPIQDGGGFLYDDAMHDKGPKQVLGLHVPAGGGFNDGMELLDYLGDSPLAAHFISRELCQFFLSDNPPADLVNNTAKVFLATHGDIKRVLLSIFTSQVFTSAKYYKYKNPYEYIVSAIRAADASFYPSKPLFGFVRSMGLIPFLVNSPKGYSENSASWMDSDLLLEHSNFALALAKNQIKEIDVNYKEMFPNGPVGSSLEMERDFSSQVVGSPLDAKTSDVIAEQIRKKDMPLAEIYALLLDSPEFQER